MLAATNRPEGRPTIYSGRRRSRLRWSQNTEWIQESGSGPTRRGRRPFLPAQDTVVSAAEATGREIDLAVRQLIEDGEACARHILEKRRPDLDAGVELLIAHETLTAEQFITCAPQVLPPAAKWQHEGDQ